MEALRLRKKFPEVTQDEIFDLINRFKCVPVVQAFWPVVNEGAVRYPQTHPDGSTRLAFSRHFNLAESLTIVHARLLNMSALMPVEKLNWRIG